ncbi:MAG: HAMP domain-containing histidine kinase [Myxococcales bacterium]|nr:HAMP domain-containing histidine kinase [Myxococcales bacterium]
MRIAAKATLYVGTGYLLTVCALAFLVHQRISTREEEVAQRAANLVGHEIAAALSEASLARILRADLPTRTHLRRLIDGLTEDSALLASVTVVNELGTVVASDNMPVGTTVPRPGEVFGTEPEIRYLHQEYPMPAGGSDAGHTVMVPLVRSEHLRGYVRLTLADSGLEGLYRDAYRELMVAAFVGLLLVGGLGFALHRELRHRGHTLTRTLEAIRLGRSPEPLPERRRDEFSEALEVAGTLGRELDRMRRVGGEAGEGELTLDDPRAIDDLTSATRLRTLAQIYRALAHELRAPLQAMSLHIDSLRDHLDHPGEADEQPQRDVNTLATELKRLDQSLLAVLSETAPEREEASRFDLRALVLELEDLLAAQSRRQGVKFEATLPDEPVRVRGHRNRLKQALLNVVMNAFEVQPGGGTVAVSVEAVEGVAQLTVEDAGPGIPEEARGRIFDLHFSTKDGGTGIGLTVARAVVEATGGRVEVGPAGRGGAAIQLRFPLEEAAADA